MRAPMHDRRHPYADFIQGVEKPARYLGGEYLSVVKSAFEVRICLAFPEIYDIGMSHLGTKILYSLLNKDPAIACERAFVPWVDMERELRARALPLVSLETATPLRDFDVVGLSLQYEMTYTNALNLLDLGGIPRRAKDRGANDPIVLGGGPTATHPEPVAPFFDALLIGDGEAALPAALLAIAAWKREGLDRHAILYRLAHEHTGWYVPALYDRVLDDRSGLMVVDPTTARGPYPVKRAHVADLDRYPFPSDSPVAAAEAIFDRVSIEIARGCTEGCRFCQAGMIYRPVRERDPDSVVDTVIKALDIGGYDEASLTSLSTADYSCISPLIKKVMGKLRERRASLSVSSLRAYGLDEDLLDEISSVKATGLTFAPEAGTQRMRDVINKNISEEDLLRTAERVFQRGWQRMKFYFMIGLPTETDEDVLGIIDTAAKARDVGLRFHARGRLEVTASVSSLVPKPHTPFQWAKMDGIDELERKQRLLRDHGRRKNIQTKWHNWKESYIEGILSRGDIRCADLLDRVFDAGCRLDSWDDHLRWDLWLACIAEWKDDLGVDPKVFLDTIPLDGRLPWDHLDVGLEEGFLSQEWKRATKNRLSPPCGKPKGMQVHHTNVADSVADQRKLVCYHCGIACDLTAMREERVEALTQLGAMTPDDVRAEGFVPGYKQVRKDKIGRSLPPLRQARPEEEHRYRLRFTKLGPSALVSHLDLARSMPRVIRRAGLTQQYSSGFTPRALLSYGPALSLGLSSLGEYCDIYVHDGLSAEELVDRLNAISDPGIVFLDGKEIPESARPITKVARVAEYLIALPGVSRQDLDRAVVRARGADPVMASVMRKHGPKPIDVRDGLVSIAVELPDSFEYEQLGLDLLGPIGPVLRWRVDLTLGAHVRPNELAQALLSHDDPRELPGLFAARVAMYAPTADGLRDLLDPTVTAARLLAAELEATDSASEPAPTELSPAAA
ncbi:MAG: TIGR03960 family B12-binding radical SAM protein [Deltaproteobacteria bacterium]|nr:TIGR03960 family B12-binding radical SAM protein [Deltaproteobacteria bacterium]